MSTDYKAKWGLKHLTPYKRAGIWHLRRGQWRKSLGTRDDAEARRIARLRDQQYFERKLATIDPGQTTLGTFVADYLQSRRLTHSPATVRRDGSVLNALVDHLGPGLPLKNLTARRVGQWINALLERGTKPITVNSHLRHLRAAINVAVEWEVLAAAPRLRSVPEPERPPVVLLPKEAAKVLALETNAERAALWRFVLWTGLRRAEVIGLTWQHVHLDEAAPWMEVTGKGQKTRLVPLLPEAVQALRAMPRADVGPVWVFHFRGYHNPKTVTGSPLSRWFKAAARRAGLPDAHFHTLRHTAATWMAARGVSERVIQQILGHASITTTQIYTKGLARMGSLYDAASVGLAGHKKGTSK